MDCHRDNWILGGCLLLFWEDGHGRERKRERENSDRCRVTVPMLGLHIINSSVLATPQTGGVVHGKFRL